MEKKELIKEVCEHIKLERNLQYAYYEESLRLDLLESADYFKSIVDYLDKLIKWVYILDIKES